MGSAPADRPAAWLLPFALYTPEAEAEEEPVGRRRGECGTSAVCVDVAEAESRGPGPKSECDGEPLLPLAML